MEASMIKFLVFNRNYSLADEMLGVAEVSIESLSIDQTSDSQILPLLSTAGEPGGFLEVQMKLTEKV